MGVGEAGGTPPCNAIVADYFPPARRPMALGVFALGAPIGAWLGADIAGMVANLYGWRATFLALGIPGVLLGVLVTAGYAAYQGWPLVIPANAGAGGLCGAVAVGMIAGVYPSIRASRLTPTEALATS